MFQSYTTENILPVSNSEPIEQLKPSNYSWKTLTKAGLVFVMTTGAFLALKTTGSFTLISSWLKNRETDFDEQETKLVVRKETEGIEVYFEYSDLKESPLAAVKDSRGHITFMPQRAKRNPTGIPEKIGPEFQVNTYTTSSQCYPSVAGLCNGKFVITWQSGGQDGSDFGVYGQMFNANSTKFLSEFQVNTYTANYQRYSSVTGLSDGKFVVTWTSEGQDGDNNGIYGQMFNANSTKFLSEFQVNTYTANYQRYSSVTGLSDGKFVVVWESGHASSPPFQDGNGWGVYGQIFNANGTKFLSEFQVNTYTTSNQYRSSVANLSDSKFVITWTSEGQDGDNNGIYGQIFNANGTKFLSEFQVNTYTTDVQLLPSVAGLNNGEFVVTWLSYPGQDGDECGVYGQMFNANGTKFLSELQVNTYTVNYQGNPSIASLSDGKFVVTWTSEGQDGNGWGVYGQIFNANGTKFLSEFQVNTYTVGYQDYVSVVGLNDDKFVVTWRSNDQDGDSDGVYGQMFWVNETFASSYFSSSQQIPESSSEVSSYGSTATSPGTSGSATPTSSIKSSSHLSDQSVSSVKKSSLSLSDTKSESLSESFNSSPSVTSVSTSAVKTSSPTSTMGSSTQGESSSSILVTSDQSQRLSSVTQGTGSIGTIIGVIIGGTSLVLCIVGGTVGYFLYRKNRKVELKEIDLEDTYTPKGESKKERMSILAEDGSISTSLIIPYKKLKLGQKIGGGGSGIVYKGRWQHTDVAIKQLHSIEFDPHAKIEFNREVSIMAALRHTNIVSLFGICFEPEFCIVMEYMEGGSLYSLLHSNEELPWSSRLHMAMDITRGLAYLHEKDIVHRDLKSLNVLLTKDRQAKLTDFGLSKEKTGMAGTMTKGLIGTARWIAPELMDVEKYEREGYTKKADIYSYGMILYELSSRQVPFQEDESEIIVMKKVEQGSRPKVPEDCPEVYGILLSHCWRQKPEARPDINTAIEALETCCDELPAEETAKCSTNEV